jgi:hypothetical protein
VLRADQTLGKDQVDNKEDDDASVVEYKRGDSEVDVGLLGD